MSRKRAKRWARSLGPYGSRIRVFEKKNGMLYAETFDPTASEGRGGYRRRSLGHRDKDRAVRWAKQQAAHLMLATDQARDAAPTVSRVVGLYRHHKSPSKGTARQQEDQRCATMWTRHLGASKDLQSLSLAEWENFIMRRRTGAMDAHGNAVPEDRRRPVRDRTVEADLNWLCTVMNWASKWQDAHGQYVMPGNPARGYPKPREKNPRRPVATQDRYETVRAVTDQITMVMRSNGTRTQQRSYLSELLDITNGSGRRISAVRQLRYHDLSLEEGPHGAIHWPADTDKMGKQWTVPMNTEVRVAVDRALAQRHGAGADYLFPAPGDPTKAVSKEVASSWLRKAERLAELEPLSGSLWHAYRRKWATERKHLPDTDVAAAGGWSDLRTLQNSYQQVDAETLYRVMTEPLRLRDQNGQRGT